MAAPAPAEEALRADEVDEVAPGAAAGEPEPELPELRSVGPVDSSSESDQVDCTNDEPAIAAAPAELTAATSTADAVESERPKTPAEAVVEGVIAASVLAVTGEAEEEASKAAETKENAPRQAGAGVLVAFEPPRSQLPPPDQTSSVAGIIGQLKMALAMNLPRIIDTFREIDEDQSGKINKRGFRLALQKLGIVAHKSTCDLTFDSLDNDRSGTIEYEELKTHLRLLPDLTDEPAIAAAPAELTAATSTADAVESERPKTPAEAVVEGVIAASAMAVTAERPKTPAEVVMEGVITASVLAVTGEALQDSADEPAIAASAAEFTAVTSMNDEQAVVAAGATENVVLLKAVLQEDEDGKEKLGQRIHREVAFVQDWNENQLAEAGFTPEEQLHIDNIEPPNPTRRQLFGFNSQALTTPQRKYLASSSTEDDAEYMRGEVKSAADMNKAVTPPRRRSWLRWLWPGRSTAGRVGDAGSQAEAQAGTQEVENEPEEELADGWQAEMLDDGRIFYWNAKTEETSWVRPSKPKQPEPPEPPKLVGRIGRKLALLHRLKNNANAGASRIKAKLERDWYKLRSITLLDVGRWASYLFTTLSHPFRSMFLACSVGLMGFLCVPVLLLLLPIRRFRPTWWYSITNPLFAQLWATFIVAFEVFGGLRISFFGEEPMPGEKLVIFANHHSSCDWLVLLGLAARFRALEGTRFVAETPTSNIPFFKTMLWLQQTGTSSDFIATSRDLGEHSRSLWLCLFPENNKVLPDASPSTARTWTWRRRGSSQRVQPQDESPKLPGSSESVPPPTLSVKCPPGFGAGHTVTVEDPSTGKEWEVTMPEGIAPGQTFEWIIPQAPKPPPKKRFWDSWTNEDAAAAADRLFKELDADGSGKISRSELELCMREIYGKPLEAEVLDKMIADFDVDGDGEIDLMEFRIMMRACEKEAEAAKEAMTKLKERAHAADLVAKLRRVLLKKGLFRVFETFRKIDVDGSGEIEVDEFSDAMRLLGLRLSDEDVDLLFRQIDADGSGTIEYRELNKLLRHGEDAPKGEISVASPSPKRKETSPKRTSTSTYQHLSQPRAKILQDVLQGARPPLLHAFDMTLAYYDSDTGKPASLWDGLFGTVSVDVLMRRIPLPKGPVVPNSVGTLKVTILHATNLLSADSNGKSDPYVVVKAGGMAQRTKHVLETLDPVWNKTMEFQGKLETFLARPLHLKLFDMDVFSADDPLGEVKVSLDYLILGGQQDFVERVQPVNGTLDPSQGTLKVTIKHANGLMAADSNGLSDPYVAVHAGGFAKKSKVIPKTLDPVWNVTWELQGKLEVFLAEPMHIEIFDKDPFISDKSLKLYDDPLGDVRIPLDDIIARGGKREMTEPLGVPEGAPEEMKEGQGTVSFEVEWISGQGTVYFSAEWLPSEGLSHNSKQNDIAVWLEDIWAEKDKALHAWKRDPACWFERAGFQHAWLRLCPMLVGIICYLTPYLVLAAAIVTGIMIGTGVGT